MSSLEMTLPLPPSANNLFANVKGKGRVKTRAYVAWIEEAGWHARTAWQRAGSPKFTPPIALDLRISCNRGRDITNCTKAIEDLIVAVIPDMPDDRWNDVVNTRRIFDGAPRAVVTIFEITNEDVQS